MGDLSFTSEYLLIPSPLADSHFALSSQCVGETPTGQDFEAFMGPEKAKEFKGLFSSWINTIYRASWLCLVYLELHITPRTAKTKWPLFSLEQPPASSGETSSAGSTLTQGDGGEGAEDIGTGAQQGPASATTTTTPPMAGTASLQPAAIQPDATLPMTDTASLQPAAAHPTISPEIDTTGGSHPHLVQSVPDLETPSRPSPRASPPGADPLVTIGDLLSDARETVWMKSKKTLQYFRGVHKIGKLSDLILHWHQFEEALGFPETVSYLHYYLG